MSTDLIKVPHFTKMNTDNGTLYNFSQFNNDLAKAIANTNAFERVPSKFVCVKLPNWTANGLRHMFIEPDKIVPSGNESDPNVLFPALLQNYIENFYAYAKKGNVTSNNTVEWAFWKLLHNLGAIQLTTNANGDVIDSISGSIIQYVGDINVVNYVEYGNRTYTEQYLHIPSTATRSSINFAKSISNIAKLPVTGVGSDASLGLEISATEINNAVYDFDENGNSINYYDLSQQWSKSFLNFTTISQSNAKDDFDFNCILLYYDTYEIDSAGNKINFETKLGSIMMLNSFEQNLATNEWSIKTVTKYNDATSNTAVGNAIAYRLCTNFFSTNEQSVIDTIVNDYNTVSMDLYVHALQKMLETGELFKNAQIDIETITEQLAALNYGTTLLQEVQTNRQLLNTLTQQVNSVIGAAGYTVTNFQLLDAFAKLSNDFKGTNGPNVTNTFVFNQGIENAATVNFNEPYVYSENGKYSVAYSEESMLSVALIRNKVLSKYAVNATINNNALRLTLVSGDATNISYCADYKMYNNAANNQYVELSFATNAVDAKHYILVINKSTGLLECRTYDVLKKLALKDFAYVADFVLPTLTAFQTNGLTFSNNISYSLFTNTFEVKLNNEKQGSYVNGDTVFAGQDVKDVVAKMLVDYSLLQYKQPTISIFSDDNNLAPFVNANRTFNINFEQNNAGPLTQLSISSNIFKAFCTFRIRYDGTKYYLMLYTSSDAIDYEEIELNDSTYTATSTAFKFLQNNSFLYVSTDKLSFESIDDNSLPIELVSQTVVLLDISVILAEAVADGQSLIYEFNIDSRISMSSTDDENSLTVATKYSFTQANYLAISASASFAAGEVMHYPNGEIVANSIQSGNISNYKVFNTLSQDLLMLSLPNVLTSDELLIDVQPYAIGFAEKSKTITGIKQSIDVLPYISVLYKQQNAVIAKAYYDNNEHNDITKQFNDAEEISVLLEDNTQMFCKTLKLNAPFLFDTPITITFQ